VKLVIAARIELDMTEEAEDVMTQNPTEFENIMDVKANEMAHQFLDAANAVLKADVIMDELITSWSTQEFRVKIQQQ
jgi:tellurite resistance protein